MLLTRSLVSANLTGLTPKSLPARAKRMHRLLLAKDHNTLIVVFGRTAHMSPAEMWKLYGRDKDNYVVREARKPADAL